MATTCTLTSLVKEGIVEKRFILDEDDRPKVAYNEFSDVIPVISLDGVEDDSPGGRREAILKKIVEACEEWGMFQVVDHGIDPKLVDDMSRLSREFFCLPDEEKLKYDMKGEFAKGGFLVSSHLKDEAVANWREMMAFIPYPIEDRDYSRWPNKPEEWRAVTEVYSEKMLNLASCVLGVLSEAMNLERDAILNACKRVTQRMSVNFYPKCPEADIAIGLIRHNDPSTITFVQQDQVGGLQVTKDGAKNWITVKPVQGAFVVNLGTHSYFLSNGRFKSADHRAVVNYDHSRLSIATFINADKEAIVYPLKIEEGQKSVLEKPITFAEMYKIHFIEQVKQGKLAKEQRLSKKP